MPGRNPASYAFRLNGVEFLLDTNTSNACRPSAGWAKER
jgi:hypothetical protein